MGFRQRFCILDVERILRLLGGVPTEEFRRHYEVMINERIAKDQMQRDPRWTKAIAVGSEGFVWEMAIRVKGRQRLDVATAGDAWVLRESEVPYTSFPGPKIVGQS